MEKLNLVLHDPWLQPFEKVIYSRFKKTQQKELTIIGASGSLKDFASGYLYFGLHRLSDKWIMREWAPNATAISVLGTFNDWKDHPDYQFKKIGEGIWELILAPDKMNHGDLYKLRMQWKGGEGNRIPAYVRRVVQDPQSLIFNAQVWFPEKDYKWEFVNYTVPKRSPIVYEAHVGMATEDYRVGTFKEFTQNIIPRIVKAGYNTIQLMAVQEHPYYGSFGYHVSSFYAPSSRFGTPEELKELIDTAHKHDIAVVMDLVHSHAVKNEIEGLNRYDGSKYQFFHEGEQRNHPAWDSLCFNYGKNEVVHFLLSNCKYWLDEFHFDGFRFDGVTSMLYYDHGLSKDFTEYKMYYDGNQDEDALDYIVLANKLIHQIRPDAITIAEEMSGMPGTATPAEEGGLGFDYRLAMGTPDYWIKLIKEVPDERWDVGSLFYELTRKRHDEKTIGYAESHDQALVGDKTIVFRLMDKEIYFNMQKDKPNLIVDRAIALHKLIRLVTLTTAGDGYLNFMGNEFGHPEWIDFPRVGNNWSYHYCRRQWSLVDSPNLKYHYLGNFDKVMLELIKEYRILEHPEVFLLHENKLSQVLAFKRGDLIFVFNFNPDKSYQDYGIQVMPGKYHILLDTDSVLFGGSGNVDETMVYYTVSADESKLMYNNFLKVYIPARTGLVFKKIPSKGVYDLS